MSNDIKNQNAELFIDLSEEDQEVVSAGSLFSSLNNDGFFVQRTNIETFAINESNISDGDYSFSTKQETGYALSQTTIGFSGQGGRRSSLSFCDKLFLIFLL
ncbi:MAG: hypothetical protein RM347_015265 [Nostoc sp. ChiQUE02]|uniref:hypothetical protein n=1 Tax=Nostoc sp. ChiQUE02 TaxID=3075377 RepID=UPI002AD4E283|nr:hypothetical protein [Nostoc sp. ChiQUE02]MDZ8229529.1 hypothetical protein [Nostoc sp. ChiQUE02]